MSQLDGILKQIGEFGKFQKGVYALLNFLTILQCCQMFLLVFVADKPQWQCSKREQSYLDDGQKNQGYPCYRNGSMCYNVIFDDEFTSIATEWKLVCNEEYKTNLAQAVVMAGCLTGAVVFGGLADRRGRKYVIILMQSLASVFCFASGLVQSYQQFVILRFLCAATLTGSGTTVFVLISEIIGPGLRDILLTAHQAFYSLGYVVLAGLAYNIRDWRHLTLVVSTPYLICTAFFLRNICESPQWLLENGKFNENKELIKDMAKTNGSKIPEKSLEELTDIFSKENSKAIQSQRSVLSTKGYFRKIITLSTIWLFFAMVYYGLSFASKSTSSNKYISFSFSGLVEIPSLVFGMLLIKSGRQMPMFCLTVTATISCLVCAWLLGEKQSQLGLFVTMSAMLGKFGVVASYNIIYIFSSELFPAAIRSFSMGICSTTASIGGILAPVVVSLDVYDKRLPMLVFGIAAMCSAVLVMTLPETVKTRELDKKRE